MYPEDDVVRDPPKTWNRTDEDTIESVDRWIQSLHPDGCEAAAVEVFPLGSGFMTTASRLASHCISEHNMGLQTLALLDPGAIHYYPSEVDLAKAVRSKQKELIAQFENSAELLDNRRGGPLLANVIARNVDDDHFGQLWNLLWKEGFAHRAPRVAAWVLRAAAFDPARGSVVRRFVQENLDEAFNLLGHDLVFVLIYAESLGAFRDEVLSDLVRRRGVDAAKKILEVAEYGPWIPSCVPTATRLVLEQDPEHTAAAIGVALCLEVDPEFALVVMERWANREVSRHLYHPQLIHKVEQWDQARLLERIATGALEEDEYRHQQLAMSLRHLISNASCVAEWIGAHLEEPRAARYAAGLVVAYLSEPRGVSEEVLDRLRGLARELHRRYGHRSEQEVLEEWNLTDPSQASFQDLRAIALAKDVAEPPRQLNPERVLANIRCYPFTYRALGGEALDDMIAGGDLPVCALVYDRDIPHGRERDAQGLLRGDLTPRAYEVRERMRQSQEAQRQRWEERFRNIYALTDAFTPRESKRLREDPYSWTEVVVLERLLPFFGATREPTGIPGLEEKRLDFLLDSEDGELLLEVATVGVKPADVREGTKMSTGGQTKKTLLNKWREQLNECSGEIPLPVVITIKPQWPHDLEFDLMNSLFGLLAFSYTMDTARQEVVEEGTTRKAELAFFALEGVECISAVASISFEGPSEDVFGGRLFRPLRRPQHPIPPKLWVRLRTALYGPRPAACMQQMMRIPGIERREAETLVDHGIDDLSFFAGGYAPRPDDVPISEERYGELVNDARYLLRLLRRGRISDLRTAQGKNLSPLHEAGIYLVRHLRDQPNPPEGFPPDLWTALREEAEELLGEA